MLEVELLEDRLLLSGFSTVSIQPVPAPIADSALHSSSVAVNHPGASFTKPSPQSATTQSTGQGPIIEKMLGFNFAQESPRSEVYWANSPGNFVGVSSYDPDRDDSNNHAADKNQSIDLARMDSREAAASSLLSLMSAHLEQTPPAPGTTGGVSPGSPANSIVLANSPALSPTLPGGKGQHVPPMPVYPDGPTCNAAPLDLLEPRLAQVTPADMPGAEQPQSGQEGLGVLDESFAPAAETLLADWGRLRDQVDAFFTHLGQMGIEDAGWWTPGMAVPWLMVATAVGLELARRQGSRVPLALPDQVACRLDFLAESEEP